MAKAQRRRIDEGLSDRLREADSEEMTGRDSHPVNQLTGIQHGALIHLPLGEITPNPDQPRKHFDQEALDELTASVRDKGVLQPVIAMKNPRGAGFLLIAGERRWRAARAAGLSKIPAMIRDRPDSLEVALIENVQRQNLSPIEEAEALLRLKNARNYSDEMLAKVVGKSRTTVTETLSLNQLPEDLRRRLSDSDNHPKSLILHALRAGGPEKVRAILDGEESPTTTQLKTKKKAVIGRPKHHQESHKTSDGVFRITVTATKPKVDPQEVKAALLEIASQIA
jgi:ParB family transcriptional regulator, chromosome partitioning protein